MNEFSNFIYETSNVLDEDKCKYIIQYFEENEHLQVDGTVGAGTIKKHLKSSSDLSLIMTQTNDPEITNIINHMHQLFDIHTNIYFTKLKTLYDIDIPKFYNTTYKVQKYYKNQGFFRNHNDFNAWCCNGIQQPAGYRLFAYIFYLNTVDEGGTTSFFNHQTVKPEVGKLIFFPAEWFFMHGGNIPISSNKYILTGCFCIDI
jgi:hypothetical protein